MSNLNDQQRSIVQAPTDAPLLIIAAAGTGKTRTLTERFAYLVKERKIPADKILLLTFTKKAAFEMQERVIKATYLSPAQRSRLWVHTFHAFCARLVRDEAAALNLPEDFEAIDPAEQQLIYDQVLSELASLSGDFQQLHDRLQVFDITLYKRFVQESYPIIEKLREKIIQPHEFKRAIDIQYKNTHGEYEREYVFAQMIYLLYARFNERLDELGLKDFSKLIMDVIVLLRDNTDIRKKYMRKFSFVMVDEFQDTSHAQFELLRLLCNDQLSNLTVVGDPRQSIYQWRDADPANLEWVKNRINNLRTYNLQTNYRSYADILDFSNALLQNTEYKGLPPLLPRDESYYSSPAVFCFEGKDDEPVFIAAQIRQLIDEQGYNPGDIAILLRQIKNKVSLFESALEDKGVPYYTSGSGSFFGQDDIQDYLSYLRIIDNPLERAALVRILQRPPYNMPDGRVYALYAMAKKNHISMFEQLKHESDLVDFYDNVTTLSSMKQTHSVLDIFYRMIDLFDLKNIVYTDAISYTNRRERLAKYINLIKNFQSKWQVNDLTRFVELCTHGTMTTDDNEMIEQVQAQGCVRIMTLHKAKGLEFPVVFLSGLKSVDKENASIKNNTGRMKPFFIDRNCTIIHKESPQYEPMKNDVVNNQQDEWWRLYYVGITRAQQRLYLTGSDLSTFVSVLETCKQQIWQMIEKIPEVPARETSESDSIQKVINDAQCIEKILATPQPVYETSPEVVSLSCSIAHQYEMCPYYYYIRYILGIPESPVGDSGQGKALRWDYMGTVIHEAIEAYHLYGGKRDLKSCAEDSMSHYDAEQLDRQIIEDALEYYLTTPYASDSSDGFYAEYPFSISLDHPDGPIELKGQIDRLYIDDKKCRILDYKTGMQQHDDQYRLQMELYALACQRLLGAQVVETELLYLSRKEVVSYTIQQDDFDRCLERVAQIASGIRNNRFDPHDGTACRCCAVKEYCSATRKRPSMCESDMSYYAHFYNLIDREEQACCSSDGDLEKKPLRFMEIHVKDTSMPEDASIVEFATDTDDTHLRKGDMLRLYDSANSSVSAKILEITHKSIILFINDLKNWEDFVAYSDWQDRLGFERMKNNLFDFLRSKSHLKDIILEKVHPATIDYTDQQLVKEHRLDSYQQQAVKMALACNDFLLVQGPPGTGKTVTIAAMVYELMQRGMKVLICAYTNRAVDAILRKLLDITGSEVESVYKKMYRIGNSALVDRQVRPLLVDEHLSTDRIAFSIMDARLVALTSAGIRPDVFAYSGRFDVSIIDEASQMPEPFAIGVANYADRLIMVGDDKQLPPIVTDPYARQAGLGLSLFERMKTYVDRISVTASVMLKNQYRMNELLMQFSSKNFYDGGIHAGTKEVAVRKLDISITQLDACSQLAAAVLDPESPLVYVDLGDPGTDEGTILSATTNAIVEIIKQCFCKTQFSVQDIGIISPYRRQVAALRKELDGVGITIDTIDRFQGSDREVIILACPFSRNEIPPLLQDPKRLNVALTRAKSKLIVVGYYWNDIKIESAKMPVLDFILFCHSAGLIVNYKALN